MTRGTEPILEIRGLAKHYGGQTGLATRLFGKPGGPVRAVDGVDLVLRRGETLGLVGESGCGKSTLGRTALLLETPTAGEVVFDGANLMNLTAEQLRRTRRRMQMIFQDPAASLNPRKTVHAILDTPVRLSQTWDSGSAHQELVEMVGLGRDSLPRYPHQFSGGQKQRIGIARALASRPEVIIADEPVASLDVSVQAQILRLLVELQEKMGLSYVFISHDLNVVRNISDRIAVMYLGRLVEVGPAEEISREPLHPYTRALLSAVPRIRQVSSRILLSGEVPDPANPPPGCRFHPRCYETRLPECTAVEPQLAEVSPGRFAACHLLSSADANHAETDAGK